MSVRRFCLIIVSLVRDVPLVESFKSQSFVLVVNWLVPWQFSFAIFFVVLLLFFLITLIKNDDIYFSSYSNPRNNYGNMIWMFVLDWKYTELEDGGDHTTQTLTYTLNLNYSIGPKTSETICKQVSWKLNTY